MPTSGWPLVLAIVALVIGSGAFGNWVTKVTPQRVSKGDQIQKLNDRIDKLVTDHATQINALEQKYEMRIAGLETKVTMEIEQNHRISDYVEDLRVHISEGKGPPPPDWPMGVRS